MQEQIGSGNSALAKIYGNKNHTFQKQTGTDNFSGIFIYSGSENNDAYISQDGNSNHAIISQYNMNGGNQAVIFQKGEGNEAVIEQYSASNLSEIHQSGNFNEAHTIQ